MADKSGNNQAKNTTIIASLCIIAAGSMWGSMGLWVHSLTDAGLSSMDILSLRVTVTAVIEVVLLFLYDSSLLKLRPRDLWCFFGTGILSVVFFGYCYNICILLTSMSTAAVLLYTSPVFVMILSRLLFGEALTPEKIVSVILAFAGCVLVTGIASGESGISLLGLMTGLGCGFGYGLYSIFGRYALNFGYHPFTVTVYTFICAAVTSLIICDRAVLIGYFTASFPQAAFGVAYAVFTTVLPYILYTLGLQKVETGRAAILATIEPVVATLLGTLVMQEPITFAQLLGVVLVLLAIILPELIHAGHRPA